MRHRSPLALAVRDLVATEPWEGTAAALLEQLVAEGHRPAGDAKGLVRRLNRVARDLDALDVVITRRRSHGRRLVHVSMRSHVPATEDERPASVGELVVQLEESEPAPVRRPVDQPATAQAEPVPERLPLATGWRGNRSRRARSGAAPADSPLTWRW